MDDFKKEYRLHETKYATPPERKPRHLKGYTRTQLKRRDKREYPMPPLPTELERRVYGESHSDGYYDIKSSEED